MLISCFYELQGKCAYHLSDHRKALDVASVHY